jgi:electron transfer flavoprotein alpha/beta subunit
MAMAEQKTIEFTGRIVMMDDVDEEAVDLALFLFEKALDEVLPDMVKRSDGISYLEWDFA